MRNNLFLAILILFSKNIFAQKPDSHLVGDYYLQGVREIASGFQLNADYSFEFFFSYGALDRNGSGTWAREGDFIVFNSSRNQEQDYKMLKSEKRNNKGITIKIVGNDAYLTEMVTAQIYGEKINAMQKADANGLVIFEENRAENIFLFFKFCPEKHAKFEIIDKSHNYFEFSFLPSLFELSFHNFKLKISKDSLEGKHLLLDEKEYSFVKRQ